MARWSRPAPSSRDRTEFQIPDRGHNTFPNTPFFSQLIRNAHAGYVAIRDDNSGQVRTYAQLLADALNLRATVAKGLDPSVLDDLARGEEVLVGVLAPGSYEFAVAVIGVYALGAAVVPMTVALPKEEALYFVSKSRQVAIVASASAHDLGRATAALVKERHRVDVPVFDASRSITEVQPDPSSFLISSDMVLDDNSAGLVIFTSGTSGPPKGAVLRRAFFSEDTRATAEHYGVSHRDVILHVLPVHHATGAMINFLPFLMSGACIEFRSGSFDAEWTWNRWVQGGITVFSGVPTIYTRMMRYYDQHLSKLAPQSRQRYREAAANIRVMMCGTSALPRPLQSFWTTVRNGRPILTRYGSTELSAVLKVPEHQQDGMPDGSVGTLFPGADAKLSDGDEGELLVKAPYMFSKYLFDDDATKKAFDDEGYFKTGDIARREGKFYTIIGRASQDIIKSGGYKISALDIEREMLSLSYVNEAIVVGVDDEEWGQRVAAVISLREDQSVYSMREISQSHKLTITRLREDLRDRLAGYKMPTLLSVFEGELPKTASGKVLKRVLGPQVFPSPGWHQKSDVQAFQKSGRAKL